MAEAAEVQKIDDLQRTTTQHTENSQTASDYIETQLALEADAKEILPYKFDKCTYPLGPLRQTVFACLTCSPPPASPAQVYTPAGVCYACSIACHGDHHLVELFSRRNFACDCGTSRIPDTSPCTLRSDSVTGARGVHSQQAWSGNRYNHNFQNKFCGCEEEYDAEKEKGTMFQCIGLGTTETGGCGEDWWHPECLLGLPRHSHQSNGTIAAVEGDTDRPNPPGFPAEDDFEAMICYKCVESHPWIKQYGGTPGFLPPVFKDGGSGDVSRNESVKETSTTQTGLNQGVKRKMSPEPGEAKLNDTIKQARIEQQSGTEATSTSKPEPNHKHDKLPKAPEGMLSMFLKEDFREHFCHCPQCYPNLIPHQQLVEEEETYEPSVSDSAESQAPGSGARSQGTGSLLDRGEAALSTIDRVRAIEGVMVYNHLKDKVKDFLKPYAESGKAVSAEDIKTYFEKLRGDEAAIKEASSRPLKDGDDADSDNRREQSGY